MGGGRSAPTDLRPSPAKHTIPQEVPNISIYDIEGTSSYGARLTRHLRAMGIEVLAAKLAEQRREVRPLRRRSRRTSGAGRRSVGRAQERRRARGDDQGPACGPSLRDEGEDAGRQPAPGLARDGTGAAAPPFARALDEGARLGGRALPPRR